MSRVRYRQWHVLRMKEQVRRYGSSDIKRMRDPEHENARLKQMYADPSLENRALKDVIEKKL